MLAGLCSLQSLQGSFCFTSFSQLLMSLAIPGAFDLVGVCVCVLAAQSCPTLCNPIDCSLPVSSVHGILQARLLEWAAIAFL